MTCPGTIDTTNTTPTSPTIIGGSRLSSSVIVSLSHFFGRRNHMKSYLECDLKQPGPSRGTLFLHKKLPELLRTQRHCLAYTIAGSTCFRPFCFISLLRKKKSFCCACQAWDARSHARERVGTTRLTAITPGHSRLVACSKCPDRTASGRKHVLGQKHLY